MSTQCDSTGVEHNLCAPDDFAALLETTEVMKQVLKSLRQEPAQLLGQIRREYQTTGQVVPDHRLYFADYVGVATLKALLSAGLIRRHPGGSSCLYSFYEPPPQRLEQYERLRADGFYEEK